MAIIFVEKAILVSFRGEKKKTGFGESAVVIRAYVHMITDLIMSVFADFGTLKHPHQFFYRINTFKYY